MCVERCQRCEDGARAGRIVGLATCQLSGTGDWMLLTRHEGIRLSLANALAAPLLLARNTRPGRAIQGEAEVPVATWTRSKGRAVIGALAEPNGADVISGRFNCGSNHHVPKPL